MTTPESLPDLDRLPPDRRLALAYAPARWRSDVAALLLLDTQLAGFVANASEPILGQMRLAWWRDRFAEPVEKWPKGNPLLAQLAGWEKHAALLGPLVDAWERALGDRPLDKAAMAAFARDRGQAWEALAAQMGYRGDRGAVETAATRWSLVDFAWNHADEAERPIALRLAENSPTRARIGTPLKPLAALEALACRALATGRPPLSRASDLLFALRGGLFGR